MVLVLILGFVTALITIGVGAGVLVLLKKARVVTVNDAFPLRLDELSLLGLCSIVALLALYHLLLPLDAWAQIGMIALAGVGMWAGRPWVLAGVEPLRTLLRHPLRAENLVALIVAVGSLTITVLWAVLPITNYDTGLYHHQTIQWLVNYPIVPGLGNLHGRLAFNSSFFIPAGLFAWKGGTGAAVYTLNGYLLGLFGLSVAGRFRKSLATRPDASALVLTSLLVLAWILFRRHISSPTPDVAVAVLGWFMLVVLLRRAESTERGHFGPRLLLIGVLAVTLVTFKLSSVAFLLIPLIVLIRIWRKVYSRQWAVVVLVCTLIGGVWLVRSIILSGYLVYPVAQVDLFNVDWKVSKEQTEHEQLAIRAWAIEPRPAMSYQSVLEQPLSAWVPDWYQRWNALQRTLLWLTLMAPVGFILIGFRARKRTNNNPVIHQLQCQLLYGIVCLIGAAYWFFSAPDLRFGYGYLIPAALLPWTMLTIFTTRLQLISWGLAFFVFITGGFQAGHRVAWKALKVHPNTWSVWSAGSMPEARVIPASTQSGLTIWQPQEGDQCWDAPIPCSHSVLNALRLRGDDLQDGFKLEVEATDESSSR